MKGVSFIIGGLSGDMYKPNITACQLQHIKYDIYKQYVMKGFNYESRNN